MNKSDFKVHILTNLVFTIFKSNTLWLSKIYNVAHHKIGTLRVDF